MARRRQTDRQFSGRRRVLDEAEVVRLYLDSGSRLKHTARQLSTSAAKVRDVLVRHGIDVTGLRALDADEVFARYQETRSVKQVAAKLHVAPERITEILDAAGVHRKRFTTAPPPDDDLLRQLYANGHKLEEIAEHVDWSSESIRRRLHALGLDTGRRRPVLPAADIVDAYQREHLSVQRIATRHAITTSAVLRVLTEHDVTIRTRGEANTRIDQAELRRLFDEGATTEEMARRLGATRSGIGSALERAGLHRQRPDASDRIDEIAELHAQGLGDAEIAESLGVATWNVSQLRRQHGIGRTWWDYPPPDRNELVQRVGQCVTIVELATHYRVPTSTVRRWLAHHDIEPPAHPLRGRRQDQQPGRLHHDLLQRDYVEAELPGRRQTVSATPGRGGGCCGCSGAV